MPPRREYPVRLDMEALYVRLDKQRRDRRMSWRGVAADSGLSPNVFTRLAHGQGCPSADALMTIMRWLDLTDITELTHTRPAEETPR